MTPEHHVSSTPITTAVGRRAFLQAGGAGVLAVGLGSLWAESAAAAPRGERVTVTDLGPGIVEYSLMSGVRIGDTIYIGSRNLTPTRIAAFHLPTRTVTASTELGPGQFVQGIAPDPTGRYLYAGIVYDGDTDQPNLFRWDVTTPEVPAVVLGRIPGLDVRRITVAPDGIVYIVGKEADPGVWQYDPASGEITNLAVPDPGATQSRAVAATATTVYFGAGSNLGGGGGASRASLFAVDRATGAFTSILPPELADDIAVRDIEIIGDLLYVGTEGSGEPCHIAAIPLGDPTNATAVRTEGKSAKLFRELDGQVYFNLSDPHRVCRWTPESAAIETVDFEGDDLGEVWGLDVWQGVVVVTSAGSYIGEIDPVGGVMTSTRLADVGAPADVQQGMSVAAGGGFAYVGGNGSIARHDLRTGEVVNFAAVGEAKDAQVIGGVLYTGQYNSVGVCAYDPAVDDSLRVVGALPQAQNRPLDIAWDPALGVLVAGVQSDTKGGGSFAVYSPSSGDVGLHVNPFDEYQMVRGITVADGVAYLGGDNIYKAGPRGEVAAWDVDNGTELWRIDPGTRKGICSLTVRGRHLYVMALGGQFLVVDLPSHTIVHRAELGAISPNNAQLITSRGSVYGTSTTTVFRFDKRSFAPTTLVADLDAQWYSGPRISQDEHGLLYTLRGRNLVRIDDRG